MDTMNDDDDLPEYTMDDLFETAQAILAWSDMKRSEAERNPTEALRLRMEAAESEAEGLVILRELVAFWRKHPEPDPGISSRHSPDTTQRDAEALLRRIAGENMLTESARFLPLPGTPHSPSKRTPSAARPPSQAEAPTLTGAAHMRGFYSGRAANLDQYERPALKRA
jgi:hypothetical protein